MRFDGSFFRFQDPYGSLVDAHRHLRHHPPCGCADLLRVSVFLVLLVDPVLAVRCLIVYLAVQFVENQFIYPRVVGKSVGLSPLYTLVAAMIGGKLFGIIGIIFFIPLTAVVIEQQRGRLSASARKKSPCNKTACPEIPYPLISFPGVRGIFIPCSCKARGCSPFSIQNPSKNNLKRFCYNDTI